MIVVVRWCKVSMTLFHHLKLKRPRMNSADHTPSMSQPPIHPSRKKAVGNGNNDKRSESELDPELKEAVSKDEQSTAPPLLECSEGGAPSEESEAMPQLERQNSVFDGGGGNHEGILPHLSPQLWPLADTNAYSRHFEGEEPPPLLMGGKTMVWRTRLPPSSTITSPSSPKRTPVPSPTSQQFEPAQALPSIYRQPFPSSIRPTCSKSSFESTDEESSIQTWPSEVVPDTQALNLCVASTSRESGPREDDGQPMVCMICEDRATGLHYGIITCEGCKGFFKRTVQNKRVYTCVADGNCEVTKAQRNRCQYCRFQKCVRQGMVLAAVREDRMPGGRNSGAVYNLYKVKYKKHRRGQKNGHLTQEQQQQQPPQTTPTTPTSPRFSQSTDWSNGQILKAALTSPADVSHLRHRTDKNSVTTSSSRMTPEQAIAMIRPLVECDAFEEVAKLKNAKELLQCKLELNDKLCHIGDNIVFKLVQWTKRLPFYNELPVAIHTQLLTHKWHELLVLTTCAFLAIRGAPSINVQASVSAALCSLKECLTIMVGEPVGIEELEEAAPLVERLARLADNFRRMALCMEEYVCLKVIIMQSSEEIKDQKELEAIHDRYMKALQVFVEHRFPQQTTRFSDLLACIPEVQATASLVVQSKMFYVPLFLNTSLKNET
ncbi:hormone receptor 4-like [Argiope bruennichi]|uniref:Hormone receptor 4 like protein n=1 Tax=Argiope bruennichi TaxID=94029 RepID=A0A8T0G174_ARGBR|nr:hormone receptor 4-like [Argiope bruennichi]XP_055948073.1 hormone receptor 4-like [Argiope bruennichi]XP_055948074.1 hormone receptor 4-like [Argiope bruennichi]XP_055948075.1 hormone receptor 4-like [Argiope bruennichi]XP_055948076.1 hormone receptor 4-like [Argiope bruennichi]KAF8796961.1 Hormone receptor 4 like protein [Argiope bruennichi]